MSVVGGGLIGVLLCPGSGSVVCDRAPPKATPTWIETSIGSKQSGVRPPETSNFVTPPVLADNFGVVLGVLEHT